MRRDGHDQRPRKLAGTPGCHVEAVEPRRLLSAASLDATFGSGGVKVPAGPMSAITDVEVLGDGRLLAVGSVGNKMAIARFTESGAIDPTFAPGGGDGDGVATFDFGPGFNYLAVAQSLVVTSTGKLVVAGTASKVDGELTRTVPALARFTADGAPDTSFSPGGPEGSGKYLLQTTATDFQYGGMKVAVSRPAAINGKVVVLFGLDGGNRFGLAQLTEGGALDTSFSPGGADGSGVTVSQFGPFVDDAFAADFIVSPTGKLLVSGEYAGDFAVARFTSNGAIDTTFGGGDGVATVDFADLAPAGTTQRRDSTAQVDLTADGKVVLAGVTNGSATSPAGDPTGSYYAVALARLTAAGTPDPTFGTGGRSRVVLDNLTAKPTKAETVSDLRIDAAGRLVVVGDVLQPGLGPPNKFNPTGTRRAYLVARFTPTGAADPTFAGSSPAVVTPVTPTTLDDSSVDQADATLVGAIDVDGRIVVAGTAATAAQHPVAALVRYLGDPPPDNDDQIAEANPLTVGVPRNATITNRRDADVFKFSAVAGQTFGLDVDPWPGQQVPFDSYLRVFKADGTPVAFSDDDPAPGENPSTLNSYLAFTAPATGTYYVGISGYGDNAYDPITGNGDTLGKTGPYQLTLTDLGDPDDQVSQASNLNVGQTVQASLESNGDVDLYKVALSAGQSVTIDVDSFGGTGIVNGRTVTGDLDPLLRVFDKAGHELARNDAAAAPGETAGTDPYLVFAARAAGTYYVGVSASANGGYDPVTGLGDVASRLSGKYTITLSNPTRGR